MDFAADSVAALLASTDAGVASSWSAKESVITLESPAFLVCFSLGALQEQQQLKKDELPQKEKRKVNKSNNKATDAEIDVRLAIFIERELFFEK